VGNGPVCLVGEEQYGLQTVMEVEDGRGWKRFWVGDESFFRRQGALVKKVVFEELQFFLTNSTIQSWMCVKPGKALN